jgi:hypothetical protein
MPLKFRIEHEETCNIANDCAQARYVDQGCYGL